MASRRTGQLIVVASAVVVVLTIVAGIIQATRSDDDTGRSPDGEVPADSSGTGGTSTDAAWSADGTQLYVVDDSGITILSGSPLSLTGHLDSVKANQHASWSADHARVALWSTQAGVSVWDLASETAMPAIDDDQGSGLPSWSPDGTQLAYENADEEIVLRDATTGVEVGRFAPFDGGISAIAMAWTATDRLLVTSFNSIAAFDVPNGDLAWQHAASPDAILAISPDGASAVVGSSLDDDHDVYSVVNGTVLGTVEMASNTLLAVDWSSDGRWVLAAADDDRPRLWDARAAVTREQFADVSPYTAGAAWSPVGARVAIPDAYDGRVVVIDAIGAADTEELSFGTSGGGDDDDDDVVISAIAWSSLDQLAAVGRDGTIFLWDVSPTVP